MKLLEVGRDVQCSGFFFHLLPFKRDSLVVKRSILIQKLRYEKSNLDKKLAMAFDNA